jgi:hypothetical protein
LQQAKNFKKHPVFKAGAWLGDVQGLADSGVPFLFVCICLFIIFAWLGVVQGLADSRVPFIFINVLFLFISLFVLL